MYASALANRETREPVDVMRDGREFLHMAQAPEAAGTVRPGALAGEMKPIEQSPIESIMERTGATLEEIGMALDSLGKVKLGPLEIGIRDFLPFVGGSETVTDPLTGKEEVVQVGTPAALQQMGRGESPVRGTGFATQMTPDVKLAAFDAPTLGAAAKPLVKGIGKQSAMSAQKSAIKANESLAKRMTDDWDNLSFEYSQLRESKNGQILNTDVARELSPEYWQNRTRSADVHEAASAVVKKLYADKLSQPTPEGKESIVVFSAGGTGAGKSTGLKSTGLLPDWEQALGPELQRAEMIYDTNMNTLESAITKIDQALESGRDVAIVYTFRDPLEALSEGALKRATRQEEQFGTGRTVPIVEHIKTHLGARDTIPKLAEHYKGNPRVEIAVIDNSKGAGNQEITTLDQLPELGDKLSLERKAYEIVKQQYDAGNISESTFRGTTEGLPKRATSNATRKASGNNEVPNRRGGGQSARGNDTKVVRSSAPQNKEAQQ